MGAGGKQNGFLEWPRSTRHPGTALTLTSSNSRHPHLDGGRLPEAPQPVFPLHARGFMFPAVTLSQ